MAYNIKLDIFEGPMDLLLHLIKKNELDVYDIPVSIITDQYIEYIDVMKEMNLDFAGEFLVMAATLMQIKSKMLLPLPEVEGEDEEGPDPRAELMRRLIEYKMFKEASEALGERLRLGRDVFKPGYETFEEEVSEGEEMIFNVSVFDLIEALRGVLERAPKDSTIEITVDRFKITDKIDEVLGVLEEKGSMLFTDLFRREAVRGEVVVTFLSILELAKLLMVKIHQTEDGIIRVYKGETKGMPFVQEEGH